MFIINEHATFPNGTDRVILNNGEANMPERDNVVSLLVTE